jgi:hypothetical protein
MNGYLTTKGDQPFINSDEKATRNKSMDLVIGADTAMLVIKYPRFFLLYCIFLSEWKR